MFFRMQQWSPCREREIVVDTPAHQKRPFPFYSHKLQLSTAKTLALAPVSVRPSFFSFKRLFEQLCRQYGQTLGKSKISARQIRLHPGNPENLRFLVPKLRRWWHFPLGRSSSRFFIVFLQYRTFLQPLATKESYMIHAVTIYRLIIFFQISHFFLSEAF